MTKQSLSSESLLSPSRRDKIGARARGASDKPHLLVCVNHRLNARMPSCGGRGAARVAEAIQAAANARGLDDAIEPIRCLGHCEEGPTVRIAPGGAFYTAVDETRIPEILDALEAARGD